ncbi:hypothetical protein, conserved [Babesia ovata]|uniref:6-Cys domain-containing protein n=1 Tax=Babesia ovata TaxID=189622 RepID=A0A2H6KDP4_9APIC|nr:uncharacterized protein BOVATA_026110 [Babesia ovata]GBE61118.1 hypothetical protein, conserved [Babesia ovata]
MAEFGVIIRLAICAVWLCWTISVDALHCDFGGPHGLHSGNALVRCNMDIGLLGSATVICPRLVSDTEYVWHPQPKSDLHEHINTYVSDNGKLSSVDISDVVRTESGNPFIWFESNQSRTELHLEFSTDDIYAITENRLVFICGPTDLFVSDILQRHLDRLKGGIQMQSFPWTSPTALTREIAKMGTGLGVFFLYRGRLHLPLQGCGSRPSPLFSPNNEVTVDPITGTRSCVADPMSESPIGFVCEGRLEPEDCMRSLIDESGEVVAAPESHPYWSFVDHRPWVIAKYFNDFALRPFHGECRCMDSETGQVKAKIEIRSKSEYVCDITSMIFRNRVRPIHDHWCSVVLHPGTTLTIRFPVVGVDSEYLDQDDPRSPALANPPSYLFDTEFRPKNVMMLRQVTRIYDDVYGEVMYHDTIAGDALEWDVTQISRGEAKLRYNANKPLALRRGYNSFFYHWTLKAINNYAFDEILAVVNVAFAFTHQYYIVGCDRGAQSLFYPEMSRRYCSVVSMGNGIGDVYECAFYVTMDDWQAGIHCGSDEELLPANCDSAGYDLYDDHIKPFPDSVRSSTSQAIPGFQIFDFEFRYGAPIAYSCICVDKRGYEKSKLVLESYGEETRLYTVCRQEVSHTPCPDVVLPGYEIGVLGEWPTLPRSIFLHNVYQNSVTLYVGTTLSMTCALDPDVQNVTGGGVIRTTWLPKQPSEFHYTLIHTSDGPNLIRRSHKDAIISTPHGFRVVNNMYLAEYKHLIIESRRGAILISKDPAHKHLLPITFLCGKVPDQSDLSVITDNASASTTSAQPSPNVMELSMGYTWDLVQVNVETTDPYMQGCGVTYASTELFKPETPQLYDADGQPQFGCKIDLHAAKEAAFYCPAPYLLDPPNCFSQVAVEGTVKNTRDLSKSLVSSRSNHFVIVSFDSSLVGPEETLHQTPPLQCRCVTVKGIVLSAIQIENYYSE